MGGGCSRVRISILIYMRVRSVRDRWPRILGLIQSPSQCLLPELSAWVEVGGIASLPFFRVLLRQPISTSSVI